MTDPVKARPRWLLTVMIVYTIAGVLLLLPAGIVAITSPMLSDSGANAAVVALIIGGMSAPVLLLLSLIVAWSGYGTARYRLAIASLCTPFLWILYMAAAFGLVGLFPPHQ